MKGYTSLSKQEKRYQFWYLFLLLIFVLLVLSVLFLRRYNSPFSSSDVLDNQKLDQMQKFARHQKLVEPMVEKTFERISVLSREPIPQFTESDIQRGINDVANVFEGVGIYDVRKEGYLQISRFYKMYLEDKKILSLRTQDIDNFNKMLSICLVGFKDNTQKVEQKKNAMLSRSN